MAALLAVVGLSGPTFAACGFKSQAADSVAAERPGLGTDEPAAMRPEDERVARLSGAARGPGGRGNDRGSVGGIPGAAAAVDLKTLRPGGSVVLYLTRDPAFLETHEGRRQTAIARVLAELKGATFAGLYEAGHARRARGREGRGHHGARRPLRRRGAAR